VARRQFEGLIRALRRRVERPAHARTPPRRPRTQGQSGSAPRSLRAAACPRTPRARSVRRWAIRQEARGIEDPKPLFVAADPPAVRRLMPLIALDDVAGSSAGRAWRPSSPEASEVCYPAPRSRARGQK
jgi:hypothetical protein